LITLRNAQVRRISWVRGVRPVRGRYEWPPHDAAPGRPPSRQPPIAASLQMSPWISPRAGGGTRAGMCFVLVEAIW